jgi:hypothetical protein
MVFLPSERTLPEDYRQQFAHIDRQAIMRWLEGDHLAVERLYNDELRLVQQKEKELGHPLHKGHLFYNIGMSLVAQKKSEDAVRNMLLAYVEDALSAKTNEEDEIDRAPAGAALRDFFLMRLHILGEIKHTASRLKEEDRLKTAFDPISVVNEVASKIGFEAVNLLSQCGRIPELFTGKQVLGFPQPPEQRVFIGGNYTAAMATLREIARYVRERGYTPIIADQVYIPAERVHQYTLMLLHTCCYAIFDVSTAAGQFMEIERAPDYGIKMLVIWSAPDAQSVNNPPQWISQMICSLRNEKELKMIGYTDVSTDLRRVVTGFLPELR